MNLSFTPEEQAFRAEVQRFLTDKVPARLTARVRDGKHLGKADLQAWHALLNDQGWLASHSTASYPSRVSSAMYSSRLTPCELPVPRTLR